MKNKSKRRLPQASGRSRMWQVEISDKSLRISKKRVSSLAENILAALFEKIPTKNKNILCASEISILICGNAFITKLNRDYRGKNYPTDVLSFSQTEGVGSSLPSQSLGDVVICLDYAIKQARNFKVTLDQEFKRLLIHGILHLCGFDHEGVSLAEARKMQKLEDYLFQVVAGVKVLAP